MTLANAALILFENHIQTPMKFVLHLPVSADVGEHVLRIGIQTGDEIAPLDVSFSPILRVAFTAAMLPSPSHSPSGSMYSRYSGSAVTQHSLISILP